MSNEPLRWFRMYTDAVDDEKLRLLAFEDRWHFVAIMCCKAAGMLDGEDTHELLSRKLAVKLGVQLRELDEIIRRLSEVALVDRDTYQPLAWNKRQYKSDTSAERVRKHREKKSDVTAMKRDVTKDVTHSNDLSTKKTDTNQNDADKKRYCNVTVTPPETETETETESEEGRAAQARPRARTRTRTRENKKTSSQKTKLTQRDLTTDYDIPEQLVAEYLQIRKDKRQPLTPTAMQRLCVEFDKASLTITDGIRLCVERGWASFRASWNWKDEDNGNGRSNQQPHRNSVDKYVEAAKALDQREQAAAEY